MQLKKKARFLWNPWSQGSAKYTQSTLPHPMSVTIHVNTYQVGSHLQDL